MNLPPPAVPDDAALGFLGDESSGWTRLLRGREVHFRILRTLGELGQAEQLQFDVFGVSDRDLIPANELVVVAETGGAVIGAFLPGQPDAAAGILVGWGGFVGRPRIVSDFLAVSPGARNSGLAEELKRLQAVIALRRGFEEIVWTVDPLRAANARLNFGKLGAVATGYEIDRYGSTFAPGLYGGMPSDRLHVTWRIRTPRVIRRLLAGRQPPSADRFETASETCPTFSVSIPSDIDALLASDPAAAIDWRFRVRDELIAAVEKGYAVTGFSSGTEIAPPALVLQRSTPEDTIDHPL